MARTASYHQLGIRCTALALSGIALASVLGCTPDGSAKAGNKTAPASAVSPASDGEQASAAPVMIRLEIQKSGVGLMTLTNSSPKPVTLEGWPKVELVGQDGLLFTVPAKNVPKPGPPKPVTLKPGTTAYLGIHWKAADLGKPNSRAASGMKVTAPGTTTAVDVAISGAGGPVEKLAIESFQVGTVQPSPQGVNAW